MIQLSYSGIALDPSEVIDLAGLSFLRHGNVRLPERPCEATTDLYLSLKNGSGEIPVFDPSFCAKFSALSLQEESPLVWFSVEQLFLRSTRLRPTTEPSLVSTPDNCCGSPTTTRTASIHDIARTYSLDSSFNSEPILCHFESLPEFGEPRLLVYEGRHRSAGAKLANREFILGRLIGFEHSTVRSQHLPEKADYFDKPIYSLAAFAEMYRNDLSA